MTLLSLIFLQTYRSTTSYPNHHNYQNRLQLHPLIINDCVYFYYPGSQRMCQPTNYSEFILHVLQYVYHFDFCGQ